MVEDASVSLDPDTEVKERGEDTAELVWEARGELGMWSQCVGVLASGGAGQRGMSSAGVSAVGRGAT